MKQSLLLTFLFFFCFYTTFGCSLVPNYISKFDKTEYIFIGEVIGYTNPIKFNRKFKTDEKTPRYYKQTTGLMVKVKEFVNLPKIPKTHFEVFPFELGGACETLGVELRELKKDYPINSEILVVVNEATIFPHILENGNFRLEERFARSNLIALNKDKNNKTLTDTTSILEFNNFETSVDFEDKHYLFDFEARKELKRLQDSKTQKEKETVINQLIQNPTFSIDFIELLRTNIKDTNEVLSLYEKRLRFQNEFYFKLYKKNIFSDDDIMKYLDEAKEILKNPIKKKSK